MVENVVAALVVTALAWLIAKVDATLQLWAVLLVVSAALVLGYRIGRFQRIGEDLPGYQADLLSDAISALRDFESGRLKISLEDFVERGILGPARYGLSAVAGEQIRLSVLELDESGQSFRMLYESGHSLGRKENFSLSRSSLAGHAFETRELQWTDNVEDDRRWMPHPKASNRRSYRSLASMPIVAGGEAVAVLNVLSSEKAAFLKGDLTYIELLGGLVALVWDLHSAAASSARLAHDPPELTEGN